MSLDFNTVNIDEYESICELPLEVGYYSGFKSEKYVIAGIHGMELEEATNWRVRAFPNIHHMLGVLSNWTPDILITHWHADEHPWDGPEKAVVQLRQRRRVARIGTGPFLVGQYSSGDQTFLHDQGAEKITKMLDSYDMVFRKEIGVERVAWNVAIGLWNKLNYEHGIRSPYTPFDNGFTAFLSGHFFFESNFVTPEESERRNQKRREWLVRRAESRPSKRGRDNEEFIRLIDHDEERL